MGGMPESPPGHGSGGWGHCPQPWPVIPVMAVPRVHFLELLTRQPHLARHSLGISLMCTTAVALPSVHGEGGGHAINISVLQRS